MMIDDVMLRLTGKHFRDFGGGGSDVWDFRCGEVHGKK